MTCKACAGAWPRKDHHIADLGMSVAYLHEDQFFTGWTVLVLRRHATELFQLSAEERRQLMEDVSAAADALSKAFTAVKINYELLGNQEPHIHWHLIPRLRNDPAPRQPVWTVEHEALTLAPNQRAERIALILAKLRAGGSITAT